MATQGKYTLDQAMAELNASRRELAEARADQEAARTTRAREPVRLKAGAPGDPGQGPHVTTGSVGRDSQPFSLTKALLGLYFSSHEHAKLEYDVMERFRKGLQASGSWLTNAPPGSYMLPCSFDALGAAANDNADVKYCKAVIEGSGQQYDPDEAAWLVRKGVVYKTQSAYADALGATMVAPPTMGPVIPLIRPQAALIAAGAQQFPLPPQGRHTRPRVTGAPSVQAVAESQDAPESDLATDQMELSAKKIAGLARITEEAVAFTSGTIDNIVREELNRSLGLKMDAYGFYGTGTSSIPAGLLSAAYGSAVIDVETSYPSGRGIGANGNSLLPEYGDVLPSLIEERSFNQDANSGAWIMRPGAFASAMGRRADGTTPGDNAGPLVDILRRFGDSAPQQWRGRRVVQTTNVRGDRTKGSGSSLSDAFYGIWSYCVVATYGAVQFTQGQDANTFKRGQYLVRGVLWGDVGFEYPSAFLAYKNLLGATDLI